jgi:hypothetical protein
LQIHINHQASLFNYCNNFFIDPAMLEMLDLHCCDLE